MALVTLGRMPFADLALEEYDTALRGATSSVEELHLQSASGMGITGAPPTELEEMRTKIESAREDLDKAKKELEAARADLLKQLAPWIPGDFVIVYGALLTSWSEMRGSFRALLVIAVASAFVFVIGAAFADQGATGVREKLGPLTLRAVVGTLVSVVAAVAIPNSGWSQFTWFVENESSVILTASVAGVIPLVYLLRGISKSTGVTLTG